MRVYFVRHGQSIFNQIKRHQFSDTPLSDIGVQTTASPIEGIDVEIDATAIC